MAKTTKIFSKTRPLCFLPNGLLVCYSCGNIILYDDSQIVKEHRVFDSFRERFFARDRILSRALRFGVRSGYALDNNTVLLSISNIIYEYDLNKQKLSKGFSLKERIRPLAFTEIAGINSFHDGIVFGGYLVNYEKKPVHIYRRKKQDEWDIVYSFKEGEVNHVHNIIPDPYSNCLWILTGDFGDAAAIWKATDDFRLVERVKSGSQEFRSCVAFATSQGLIYATDSPNDQNNIYLLDNQGHLNIITSLVGSCIYGCKWKDQYVFSTAVEPDSMVKRSRIVGLLNREKGPGIQDDYAHIYMGNIDYGFQDIYREKKDFFPYSIQLGAIMFPSGNNTTNKLFFYPVATKNDSSLMFLSL